MVDHHTPVTQPMSAMTPERPPKIARERAHGDLVEHTFIFTKHLGEPANGEHVALCSHRQAA
jgi:hypothetical protein